jgi:hypothetical protein
MVESADPRAGKSALDAQWRLVMIGDPLDPMMIEGPMDEGLPPLDTEAPTPEGEKVMERERPEPTPQRKALVTSLSAMVSNAKKHWDKDFKRMEADQRFAAGEQWREERKAELFNDDADDRYVANITLRHIQTRVATLYAKNPKAICRVRPKLLATVWDGNMQSLKQAEAVMQQAQQAQQMMQMMGMAVMSGQPMPGQQPGAPTPEGAPGMPMGLPMMPPQMPDPVALQEAQAVIEDAKQVQQELLMRKKIARTLELLYDYELSEQPAPFKDMMKLVIRRACTSGVGWIRLGFQRVMGKNPDTGLRIADMQQRLATLERISADIADNELQPDSAEAEQLSLLLEDLKKDAEIIVREGLLFSYPKPTAIIPDPRVIELRNFTGGDWCAEEFIMTPNEVKETYGIDVGTNYTAYQRLDSTTDYERARQMWERRGDGEGLSEGDASSVVVWEVWNKKDGLVYTICDGYPDFLREPESPAEYTDRFWPWFLVALNETEGRVYPPSDVQLIKPMQMELNRSRQGLREHRLANRPKLVYAEGLLSPDDLDALRTHPVNALISIAGLQPGQDVKTVLQPLQGSPLDPNLYEVNPVFQDLMRSVGTQEANLGGTAGNTATETAVAQSSQSTSLGLSLDSIDTTLTQIARAAGQILLLNVSEDIVKEVVGPGAMWPQLTKAEVAKDLMLEIEAGSSGRPNQQMELMAFEKLAPILMQIPGISPLSLAKEAIKRLDDKIDIETMIAEGLPSISSLNAAKPVGVPGSAAPEPSQQGPQGANNAPKPPPASPSAPAPKAPTPPSGPGM